MARLDSNQGPLPYNVAEWPDTEEVGAKRNDSERRYSCEFPAGSLSLVYGRGTRPETARQNYFELIEGNSASCERCSVGFPWSTVQRDGRPDSGRTTLMSNRLPVSGSLTKKELVPASILAITCSVVQRHPP